MVGELVEVALDVTRGQRGRTVGKQRVDGVPRQQRTVETTGDTVLVGILRKHRRHTGQRPRLRLQHVNTVLRILEVVNVRGIILRTPGRTGDEVCKLARKGNLRRLSAVQQGQLVEHPRQPLALCLPVQVQSPQGILQRFRPHGDLRGQRLLAEVLQRTTYLEILREIVLPVETHHRLALHTVFRIRLQRHADRSTGVNDALVEDGDLAGRIVHTIVRTLLQYHTTGSHHDRALRHIVSSQRNDIG